jgi:hypothetical protein
MAIGKTSKGNTKRNRPIVMARDGGCVVAGTFWSNFVKCDDTLTMQHRVTRGMGSSAKWDANPNGFVIMCWAHNVLEPMSPTFRSMCERSGWSIRRSIADRNDLARIPVRYPDGWFLLAGNGRVPINDTLALEMMFDIYGDEYNADVF